MRPTSESLQSERRDILDIPEIRARVSPVTVAQYHTFPERNENGRRTELIRGLVLEKMPKTPLHASIAKLLYDKFHDLVPEGFSVRQDQPLTLRDSEPEPDIAIVRGTVRDFWTQHPSTAALVIESQSRVKAWTAKKLHSMPKREWMNIGSSSRVNGRSRCIANLVAAPTLSAL
jgi:Uma2 family endonuclease